MTEIHLTPAQQALFDRIAASAQEVMLGFDDALEKSDEELCHAAGLVLGECYRKCGVPVVSVEVSLEDRAIRATLRVADPAGFG